MKTNKLRIMSSEIQLKTRDWEQLLNYTQQQKYRNPIAKGWFADYHGSSWRHATFYGAYIWKYPKYLRVVTIFERLLGHKPLWEDITDDNLRDLFEELKDVYAPNSLRTICATVKAVIRENNESKDVPSLGFGKIMRAKAVPSQAVYLTDKEIKRIMNYTPHSAVRRYVRRMFLIECLCGARMSDCERMSVDNIDDSGYFLTYVAKKTKTEVKVPVHKDLRQFLVSGTGDEPSGVSDNAFTWNLQEICRLCDINDRVKVFHAGKEMRGPKWRFVTSHTGRRSFATNLSLKGVSVEQISVMMGHVSGGCPNISMTQRYIVGRPQLTSQTLRVFGVYEDGYRGKPESDNA